MITFLLWICPFTWPFAIMRMRRKRDERLIRAVSYAIATRGQCPPAPYDESATQS